MIRKCAGLTTLPVLPNRLPIFFYFIIIEMSTSTEDKRKHSTLDTEATDSSQSGSIDAAALVPAGLPGETAVVILDLIKSNEAYHPIRWPVWKRWGIIII